MFKLPKIFLLKWKLIFLLLLFPFSIYSQRNGMVITKDSSGKVIEKGMMKDGKKEGEWKTFDDKGNIKTVTNYSTDKKNGMYLEFAFGDTTVFGYYKNDIRFGEWKEWDYKGLRSIEHFDEKGNKIGVCQYWDEIGIRKLSTYSVYNSDGTALIYLYNEGLLYCIRHEKNGEREGKEINYNLEPKSSKDSILSIREYSKNQKNGIDLAYENGQLNCESHYCNDLLCDTMKLFDQNGVAWDFIPFQNGQKEGVEKVFSKGHLTSETTWKRNLHNGKHFVQDELGRILVEEWYTEDILDSAKNYFDTGNQGIEVKVSRVKSDTMHYLYHVQQFSHKEILIADFQAVRSLDGNSYFEGVYKTFYENGKPKRELTYHNNEVEGKYRKWNQNGILVLESNCSKNLLTDSIHAWDDSGKKLLAQTEEFEKSVVKNMEVGMEFRSTMAAPGEFGSIMEYYKCDSADSFEDCKVYSFAEQMPQFPGGQAEMMKYLGKNIHYPPMERENGRSGTVYISFIVTRKGKIVDLKCVKDIQGTTLFSKEALRVFKSMPDWTPGMEGGKNVNVMVIQPVKFVLQ
jgi:TonB family protein